MFTINVHKHDEFISNFIRMYNYWERFTTEICLEILKIFPSSTFIDIGSNIGWFSLLAASQKHKVIAFEPIELNHELFTQSIILNKFENLITLEKYALGNINGFITININEYNMGCSSTRNFEYISKVQTNIPIFKYDDKYSNLSDLIVKIDVEHMEYDVLKGMINSFKDILCIILEISIDYDDILKLLRDNGFKYIINIGFDNLNDSNKNIDYYSKHLKNINLYYDIDNLLKNKNYQNQYQYLFTKNILSDK